MPAALALAVALQAAAAPTQPAWDPEQSFCAVFRDGETVGRPAWLGDEAGAARAAVWERRWAVSPLCAYEAAVLWARVEPAKALDLYWIGKARAQYDHARCRRWPRNEISSLYAGFAMSTGSRLAQMPEAERTPAKLQASLQRVMREPKLFGPGQDDLGILCTDAGGVRPQREWKVQADRLRAEALTTPPVEGAASTPAAAPVKAKPPRRRR